MFSIYFLLKYSVAVFCYEGVLIIYFPVKLSVGAEIELEGEAHGLQAKYSVKKKK